MFDARKALRHLSGKRFTYKNLHDEIGKVCVANLNKLPAEFGVHEIFDLLWRERWIREDVDGMLALRIPDPHRDGVFDTVMGLWPLHGQHLTQKQLRTTLEKIIIANLRDIPAEFGVREYLETAMYHGWLTEDATGYIITIP